MESYLLKVKVPGYIKVTTAHFLVQNSPCYIVSRWDFFNFEIKNVLFLYKSIVILSVMRDITKGVLDLLYIKNIHLAKVFILYLLKID